MIESFFYYYYYYFPSSSSSSSNRRCSEAWQRAFCFPLQHLLCVYSFPFLTIDHYIYEEPRGRKGARKKQSQNSTCSASRRSCDYYYLMTKWWRERKKTLFSFSDIGVFVCFLKRRQDKPSRCYQVEKESAESSTKRTSSKFLVLIGDLKALFFFFSTPSFPSKMSSL